MLIAVKTTSANLTNPVQSGPENHKPQNVRPMESLRRISLSQLRNFEGGPEKYSLDLVYYVHYIHI